MGFPIVGDAIEESLDLNRRLMPNSASAFLMRVKGEPVADAEVKPGDLLIVDRSQPVSNEALVVAILDGQLVVLRVVKRGQNLEPMLRDGLIKVVNLELWGVVTYIVREM